LVYSQGVYVLAILSGVLLLLFRGVTNRLIPLYAVGAFLAFTLSQAGMVAHWRRVQGPKSGRYMLVNGLGAIASGITVLVVLVAKFVEGAWMTALLIPALVAIMMAVHRYFERVAKELEHPIPLDVGDVAPPLVILPVQGWGRLTEKALQVALSISPDIQAVHVRLEEEKRDLQDHWKQFVEIPAQQAGLPLVKLVILKSPFRFVILPIVDYVLSIQRANPGRRIAVVIPEMIERHWWHYFLENNRAELLKALLLLRGNQRIILVNVPWYMVS
jgi:hypothetical protein